MQILKWIWTFLVGGLKAFLPKRDPEKDMLKKEAENAEESAETFAAPDRSESDVLKRMRDDQRN